jgi:hypothetical protein
MFVNRSGTPQTSRISCKRLGLLVDGLTCARRFCGDHWRGLVIAITVMWLIDRLWLNGRGGLGRDLS